jgi:hypothetical protein
MIMKDMTCRKRTEILHVYPHLSSDKMVKCENESLSFRKCNVKQHGKVRKAPRHETKMTKFGTKISNLLVMS